MAEEKQVELASDEIQGWQNQQESWSTLGLLAMMEQRTHERSKV